MSEPTTGQQDGHSEVDPAVLAGEPDSVHALEGGDDDLPPVGRKPDWWSDADAVVDAPPTALGEGGRG